VAVFVTGSAGHLGEALMRRLSCSGYEAIGEVLQTEYSLERVVADGPVIDPRSVVGALEFTINGATSKATLRGIFVLPQLSHGISGVIREK
jgi:nucleoside-diphosphate-sugar epimerase